MPHASPPVTSRADSSVADGAPDASDYAVIHRAIRRAGRAVADASTTLTVADQPRLQAFLRYWNGHRGEILNHHGIEDQIFFPALRDRVPSAAGVLDRLDADHHRLDGLMEECYDGIGRVVVGAAPTAATSALRRLADVMDDHLDLEDREIVPLFTQCFSAAEYDALTKVAIKQTGLGRQAAFTVPYIGYWASAEDLDMMLSMAPMPFRVLYRLTRRRHARLSALALGPAA
jgi:hemerythrin-like domain-containing protein